MTVSQLIKLLQDVPISQTNWQVILKVGDSWRGIGEISPDVSLKTIDLLGEEL